MRTRFGCHVAWSVVWQDSMTVFTAFKMEDNLAITGRAGAGQSTRSDERNQKANRTGGRGETIREKSETNLAKNEKTMPWFVSIAV